jgi:hypothetical protein
MAKELIVPIYLDTNTLLDLLASIEDGFSMVKKVTSRQTEGGASDQSIQGDGGTEFGIPNVLSLLKIQLSGAISSRKSQETYAETQSERYHTYGSLLARLRTYLHDNDLIVSSSEGVSKWWTDVTPSSFVEFRGVFRPNPLADSLKAMEKVARLSSSMAALADPVTTPRQSTGKSRKPAKDQMAPVLNMTKEMISDLERENIRLFVVDLSNDPTYRAVTCYSWITCGIRQ